ncbi:tRNA (adenosine(37)-N6)-threonylcarbamoyltransferase complex ATPase subunit type 1 TsaE [Vicingaceae bacterium]|nr:tRNA (adenosine(37)-N6)-threonylcarbamoyltransferase complex ATPase subunit type 1 TsaE [Vicingaceae bacterium]MDB4060748.1 tRNA (adenosine(37)-N6)-threonylcarbamoyltransferase complex ATPase subunit type 1 TsaE [Vicingaceae bacterium]MDB4082678.1 tRNA (adenosine(37)-N6)-threonylcarbamoyltransferase complex ATPase subunit type 1 TsaE [Vicingaceae bacterium]MDC1452331.1 tRNA (adenosine(37)-N6)-threonylcarbamoyltransferase complex ATPase subunit type 1 TsaE [Vicingaceae bacterium]
MKILATENELETVSRAIIGSIKEYQIIAFRGDLGAGKTTLIKNMCNLLGVEDNVSSPTFSIVNEYESDDEREVFHFDFYRLESEEEAFDIGVEDYFYGGNLCLIEWPSKIENLLPEKRLEIHISIAGKGREFLINKIN